MSDCLSFDVRLQQSFDEAVETVTEALHREGFGVLTRADVHEAFATKLGEPFRPYTILGACNPPLAYKALSARPDAGLMLPCNVIVEAAEDGEGCLVRIVNPREMMRAAALDEDPAIHVVGEQAYERLNRVAQRLRET